MVYYMHQLEHDMDTKTKYETYQCDLPSPIEILEELMEKTGTSIVRSAFKYIFFVHPDSVRKRTP